MAHVGPLGQFPREYVSLAGPRSRRFARRSAGRGLASGLRRQANELPGAYLRISRREAIVSRFATALRRVLAAPSCGAVGGAAWTDPRARDVAGRRAHFLH